MFYSLARQRNEAKKTLATLIIDYEGTCVCYNDHVLFRKDLANKVQCPQSGASHLQKDVQGNKTPSKVLRHFSLIPEIKHMFRCKKIASLMPRHAKNKFIDGIMLTPSSSPPWKDIETN